MSAASQEYGPYCWTDDYSTLAVDRSSQDQFAGFQEHLWKAHLHDKPLESTDLHAATRRNGFPTSLNTATQDFVLYPIIVGPDGICPMSWQQTAPNVALDNPLAATPSSDESFPGSSAAGPLTPQSLSVRAFPGTSKSTSESARSKCPECHTTFSRQSDRKRHMATTKKCRAGGRFKRTSICPDCGRVFTRRDSLQRHQRKSCPHRKRT